MTKVTMPADSTKILDPVTSATAELGLTALTRVFGMAAQDLQRCAPLETIATLNAALASVGRAMRADRAYIFQIVDTVFIRNTHEWCADGVQPFKDDLQYVPYSSGAVFWDRFRSMGSVHVDDTSRLLPNSELRQLLEAQHIKALIAAPFWRNGDLVGFVGLDYTNDSRGFSVAEDNLLRGFAAQIGMLLALSATERDARRLDNELGHARSRLSASVEALPELLVETDHDGVIIGFQQSSPLTFAASPQEVIGQKPEAVLPGFLAEICRKAMEEVNKLGWSQAHSYSLDTGSGRKWYTLYATLRSLTLLEKKRGYLFVIRDVTHATLQDQRMRQLVRVAELSPNIIMLTDSERRVTWINPATTARTGYTLKDLEGQRPSEVLHLAESAPESVAELCKKLDQGHSIHREIPAQSRDGLPYWLELIVQPLHNADGTIEAYMVMGIDTTAHKLVEAHMLRDRSQAISAAQDGIAIIRPNGRLSFANPAFRGFLNIDESAELAALMWTDVTPPDLTERMPSILPVLLSDGAWEGEVTRESKQGNFQTFQVKLHVQEDATIFVSARDVTLRKQAEQEQAKLREQLQRMQSRQLGSKLAAGMAHDFANVLTVISTSVDMLSMQTGDQAAKTLEQVRSATSQARDLARGLTRLEDPRPETRTMLLAPLLQQAADLLHPGLDAKIRFHLDMPSQPLTVHADRIELMQTLLNLLLNAREACEDALSRDGSSPAELRLTAQLAQAETLPTILDIGALVPGTDYVQIEIGDCGEGIPEELRSSIFTPFVTTKGETGAGLGLAVVADIVTTRSAALRIASNHPHGTRMQLFWPCTAPLGFELSENATPLAGLTVLLIDNDDSLLQELSETLVKAGAEVASCVDAQDALDAVTQAPGEWDLVVTDYDMDSWTGITLAQKMHEQREDLPIILMTGNSELHFAKKSVHSDFAATLRKPIRPSVLISVLLAANLRSQRLI